MTKCINCFDAEGTDGGFCSGSCRHEFRTGGQDPNLCPYCQDKPKHNAGIARGYCSVKHKRLHGGF